MTTYTLEIETKRDIPVDVIVEHISYALRGVTDPNKRRADSGVTVRVLDVVKPRNHPFEGPVVFDDDVTEFTEPLPREEYGIITIVDFDPNTIMAAIAEDFPFLSQLFEAKREEATEAEVDNAIRRLLGQTEQGEGDWQLNGDEDKTGEDL